MAILIDTRPFDMMDSNLRPNNRTRSEPLDYRALEVSEEPNRRRDNYLWLSDRANNPLARDVAGFAVSRSELYSD